ncbi:histone-lysine N-methyltransferase, H3 lysine-79 specific isoform X4 [Drosophila kikkawai]|uniref:Histone-lysine N-methyltransferase, H3 lysine-79 specific isoform X4 n=1 Tax=Drosophila kikkawai TaxID=30033 RepID=A0ABM4GDG2_DROKI
MSKKMWNKIFKSKSQKPQQPLAKINKRHSRGIYEEYQQLNDLLAGEKAQLNFSDQGQNEKENEHGNGNGNGCGNGNGSINVFEQQPRQSSFNSLEFSEAHQQQLLQQQQYQQSSQQQHQQQQQLSTFSRVRNTFSLRRGNNKKQLLNAKSSESATPSEMGAATAINATTAATLTNQSMQRVLIVVNKIDVATNHQTNHLHATPTATATTAVKSTTNTATMDSGVEDSMQGADTDPLPPPPPPLTTGSPLPIPEHAPPQSSGDLTPCPCCSRTFNLDALRKHIVICEKTSKKRKVFDSSRQRRDGTALSTYVLPKNFGLPNAERTVGVPVPPAPVSTAAVAAPAEPQNFPRSTARASMRKAASTLSNSSSTETPPAAPVAPAPPTVRERSQAKRIKAPACDRCPHCERTFNPKAFDRHVEWCKEKAIQANMKSGNSQETSKAKERLEARKQYKPPNLKTKRSLARDKYSGNHEELLEAGDMSAPKPNIMSLSMTSSVHSDNAQVIKARTSPAATKESRGWAGTKVTQNQVSLDMSNDEDVASSPASSVRATTSSRRLSKRQHIAETCSEIDETMDRIKRNSLKLARLDCEDAPILQPSAKTRRAVIKRGKVDAVDKELSLPNLPQVTMTFDELNGLIKRKGGTPICNVQMDEQEIGTLTTKQRSATSASIVRQARRRISTRESPSLGLQSHQQESLLAKNLDFGSFDSSMVPLQRSCNYSGSDDDDDNVDSPRAEIQIKMEATTMRTVCRPPKKSGHKLKHSESMLALPMPGLKQSLEAINKSMGQTVLPRLKLGNERAEYDQEEEDNYNSDLDYEEEGPLVRYSQEDNQSDEQEEEVEEEPVLKLPPLVKQNSNITRRLVVEQDENGTVYIKSGPKAKRRSDANTSSQSQPEERLQRQQSNASRGHEEKQSRFQELERRADAEDQQKREIFISIETEANAQGRSPISPESLRHMVGNPQTPIDVLHIENGNEPEHARFSKISDTEDAGQEPGDRASQLGSNTNTNRLAPSLSASTLAPNVQLNNAKNLMQQMQSDFRQLGEEASASVRRQLMLNSGRSEEHQQQQFRNQETGQQEQQHQHQHQQQQHAPLTPSPSADSDELSSLDGYPMSSSQSSRRGASSKLSSDSAYGSNSPYSLSRQRSSELQPIGGTTHRSQGLLRPHTASAKLPSTTSDACTQAQTQYGTLKARQRLFGNGGSVSGGGNGNGEGVECSSSGSEDSSQQPIQQQQQQQQASNYNYQQQQQQQHQLSQPAYNNNNLPMTPTISQHSLLSNNSNNSMSSSMKMSKFCHECGAKFIIEHAKFCMDCGVRRMVL